MQDLLNSVYPAGFKVYQFRLTASSTTSRIMWASFLKRTWAAAYTRKSKLALGARNIKSKLLQWSWFYLRIFSPQKSRTVLLNEFKTTVNHASAITTFTWYGQPEAADAFVKSLRTALNRCCIRLPTKTTVHEGFFNLAPVGASERIFSKRIFFAG